MASAAALVRGIEGLIKLLPLANGTRKRFLEAIAVRVRAVDVQHTVNMPRLSISRCKRAKLCSYSHIFRWLSICQKELRDEWQVDEKSTNHCDRVLIWLAREIV